MTLKRNFTKLTSLMLSAAILAGCDDVPSLGWRSNGPGDTAPPAIDRPAPDSRGVITYETYQVMVARAGDTIPSMAARVGLSPDQLARFNGLSVDHALRSGEVLALPENVGGTVVTGPTGWSPEIAATAINTATLPSTGGIGGSQPSVGTPNSPIQHRVQSGETAYSIARLYNVSVTALASWNGLGPDLTVREDQMLLIPVPDTSRMTVTPTTPTTTSTPQTTNTTTTTTTTPVTTTTSSGGYLTPVEGTVIRTFNPETGRNKSDGIDYSVAAGSPVRAAQAGTVALVSESNGDLGTIVLIRHADGVITVYGRVSNVTVAKGDSVSRGQVIGVVANGSNPSMHFEVRKGTEPVDPAPYLR